MKILFDTNVILDVLCNRQGFVEASSYLVGSVEEGIIEGYLCATTMTTIHYLTTKVFDKEKAEDAIKKLLSLFSVAPVNGRILSDALSNGFTDYEDSVLCKSAEAIKLDGIVTRNLQDFKKAKMTVYSTDELYCLLMFGKNV